MSAANGEILWKQPVKMEDTLTAEQRKKMEESRGEIEKLKAEMEDLNRQGRGMGRAIGRAADSERAALEQQRSEVTERSDAIAKKEAEMGGVTEPPAHRANGYTSPTLVSDGEGFMVLAPGSWPLSTSKGSAYGRSCTNRRRASGDIAPHPARRRQADQSFRNQ